MFEMKQAWYREPWPWLLMAGPLLVMIAGGVTAWLAVRSADGLVADDYYKQGLAINRQIARVRTAAALGLQAQLHWSDHGRRLAVTLTGRMPPESQLQLRLIHPTQSGLDRELALIEQPDGSYAASLASPLTGRWLITLEDAQRRWRLDGETHMPNAEPVVLAATH